MRNALARARLLLSKSRPHGRTANWFAEAPLPLVAWDIFDVGVVDVHQDGNLGVFTTNHNAMQSLLANHGGGRFTDVLSDLGLNQDPAFPGWEDEVGEPAFDRPGLYLYRRRNTMVVELRGNEQKAVEGSLRFLCAVTTEDGGLATHIIEDAAPPSAGAVLRFTARRGARFTIAPELVALPVAVTVDGLEPSAIFVGSGMKSPSGCEFTLHLRDRHAMAWADRDGDGRLDLFVARGGLKGRLGDFPGVVNDELFDKDGARFHDGSHRAQIDKGTCRARQACWVALDGDGPLWLFVTCARRRPQLYRQDEAGRFTDVAGEIGLDDARGEASTWVDVDGDGQPELVMTRGSRLTVYRRGVDGRFVVGQALELRNEGAWVRKLAVADYDGDGRPDIFAPSPGGNTLLVNEGGRYRAVNPRSVGLPARGGITANWVDYDNDGLVDLHVVPGGLFRQDGSGHFVPTHLLDDELKAPIADARAAWFDAFNDGSRDLLVATTAHPRSRDGDFRWTTRLFRNVGPKGHWLQVELVGTRANRQAIGATVRVRAGDRLTTQWVGCNEGSHYSQGHYRLYFGLGDHPTASSVEVQWPDGSVQQVERPVGDERLRIGHPDAR